MEDKEIVEPYWERDQSAIAQTKEKYEHFCYSIAYGILRNQMDSEECVSDTYLRAWNGIPPEHPQILSAFLGRITRNLSLDRYRMIHAKKRGEGEVEVVFDEVRDMLQNDFSDHHVEQLSVTDIMNEFLAKQKKENRILFVRRYWYMDSIAELAQKFGYSESKVKSMLLRMRQSLRTSLEEEGIVL